MAKAIYNAAATAELEARARALEEQAERLETAQSLSRPPPDAGV
ncbi:MAG TPA: hypothetical protein VN681_05730 [Stellaceae bacterium]|nr:hypothetical protein [Stellaceae bacterium]